MAKDKIKPKDKPHYVNNRDFSNAVNEYVIAANAAKEAEEPVPEVPNYIAECFLRISEGLSYKSNFIRYTYREEMVMDAVENCLKAIHNYNIERATRTEKPNAFAYFTQISWYAFLRRIAKEKKQQDVKIKFIERGNFQDFIAMSEDHDGLTEGGFMDGLRSRIDKVHRQDELLREFGREEKSAEEDDRPPEGLEMFMGQL